MLWILCECYIWVVKFKQKRSHYKLNLNGNRKLGRIKEGNFEKIEGRDRWRKWKY